MGGASNKTPDEVNSSPFIEDCLRKAKADWLLADPDDLSNDSFLLPSDDDLTRGSNMSCSPRSISPSSSAVNGWPDAEGA